MSVTFRDSEWPIVFNEYVPRPGAVVIDDVGGLGRAIVMHPDEEPHLWAAEGQVGRAFLTLKRIINQRINRQVSKSYHRIDALMKEQESHHLTNEILRDLDRL